MTPFRFNALVCFVLPALPLEMPLQLGYSTFTPTTLDSLSTKRHARTTLPVRFLFFKSLVALVLRFGSPARSTIVGI